MHGDHDIAARLPAGATAGPAPIASRPMPHLSACGTYELVQLTLLASIAHSYAKRPVSQHLRCRSLGRAVARGHAPSGKDWVAGPPLMSVAGPECSLCGHALP